MWRYNGSDAIVSDDAKDSKFPCTSEDDKRHYGGHLICESVGQDAARKIVAFCNAFSEGDLEEFEAHLRNGEVIVNITWGKR